MFRLPSLLFAAVLMTSATAFAADTPDPSSKGEAALPSGSNTSAPPSDAPANKPDVATRKSGNARRMQANHQLLLNRILFPTVD
jgi:hypothetical protein